MAKRREPGGSLPVSTPAVRIGMNLKRVQHLMRQGINEELRSLGLNAGQWAVLHEMFRAPGASSSELARSAFQTSQAMGALIARMERQGLVERRPPRGRVVENYLTERGVELYLQATDRVDKVLDSALADVPGDADRERLDRLLAMIVTTLGGRAEPAPG